MHIWMDGWVDVTTTKKKQSMELNKNKAGEPVWREKKEGGNNAITL